MFTLTEIDQMNMDQNTLIARDKRVLTAFSLINYRLLIEILP